MSSNTYEPGRLSPDAFLVITDLAPEWSLAMTKDEFHLYARYEENGRIYHFLGPNSFGYSQRQILNFASNLKFAIKRAKGLV